MDRSPPAGSAPGETNIVEDGPSDPKAAASATHISQLASSLDHTEQESGRYVANANSYVLIKREHKTPIGDPSRGSREHHSSAPLPEFYGLPLDAFDNPETIPNLQYESLGHTVSDIRLLVLLPHFGEPQSPIQCNLFNVSLEENHYCFLAVENTRGNPFRSVSIIVNGQIKYVRNNIDIFLRSFREQHRAMILWIREICIDYSDREETNIHLTPEAVDWVLKHACGSLRLDHFMETLEDRGLLEAGKHFTTPQKNWTKLRREPVLPKHFPIHLGVWRGPDAPPIPHRYLPLDCSADEIRLVVLLPATDPNAPLVAHFAHESLYGEAAFQCLSYTWGNAKKTSQIELNGQTFAITTNLHAALRDIRDSESRTVVWADQICINQDDDNERSRQIARMHGIYNMADCTLIHLGPRDNMSDLAMDFIKELSGAERTVFNEGPDGQQILRNDRRLAIAWLALYKLLARPYFRRMWIIQEMAVASIPTAFCGDHRIAWSSLHHAAMLYRQFESSIKELWTEHRIEHPNALVDPLRIHKLTYFRDKMASENRLSLLHLALAWRSSECSDDRDRLYSLWNIAKDATELEMRADYSLPVEKVYVEFVKAYVKLYHSLDVICAVQMPSTKKELPSWCPDWRQGDVFPSLLRHETVAGLDQEDKLIDKPRYAAARCTKSCTGFFDDDSLLVCAGLAMDEIAVVGENKNISNDEEVRLTIKSWYDLACSACAVRDGKAVSKTQIAIEFGSMLFRDGNMSWEFVLDEDRDIRYRTVGSHRPLVDQFPGGRVEARLGGLRFFTTKRGFMGLGIGWVKMGMSINILLGCSVPVVLESHNEHWHFQAGAFVQGWMNGEMLDETGCTDEEIYEKATSQPPFQIR